VWSTCFTVGSVTSGFAMAAILDVADWRWCFFTGALVLSAIWVQFYFFQRNRPEDVGLRPVDDPETEIDESKIVDPPETAGIGLSRQAWTNLMLVAGFYFFAKFIRYAVWSWAAYFLANNYKLDDSTANLYAVAFDLAGLPGIYLTGWISDRYFGSRRGEIALIMMIGMIVATGLLMAFGGAGVGVFAALLAFVGFTLFGPDALLSGAGAIDIGSRRAATFATATISGFGGLGAAVQEIVVARVYKPGQDGLGVVFVLLFGTAIMGTLFCAILVWRNRQGGKGI
jgi:OPA family sugar phosphate sensor protein UhpC-like MFS transporter